MNASALRKGLEGYAQASWDADVSQASPHRLIQALMEGCLTRINSAKGAAMNGNIIQRGQQTSIAIGIIGGLIEALNIEAGGAIAANLRDLYLYMQARLVVAASRSDIAAYDEVARLMRQIKSGWDAIPASQHHLSGRG
jgi:flagellar protein FliS